MSRWLQYLEQGLMLPKLRTATEKVMVLEQWAYVGEIVAAFAVVASLLFVGYQLRQSRYIERANAQRDLLRQASDWMSSLSKDDDLFEAVRECLREFHEADPIVKERFNG